MQIADERSLKPQVVGALRQYTAIASVGPLMTAALKAAGLMADMTPIHPQMAALVKAAEEAHFVIACERSVRF